jgi:sigma-E factor negative regulatory protein RseC
MIEETGLVKRVQGRKVWVETTVKTTCGSCVANDNCGTGVVAKAFTNEPELLELESPVELSVGQQVKLGIPERQLLQSSILVYLFPLFVLISIVICLQLLVPSWHELIQVGLGLLGFVSAFVFLNSVFKAQNKHQFTPLILGAVNQEGLIRKHEIPVKKLS